MRRIRKETKEFIYRGRDGWRTWRMIYERYESEFGEGMYRTEVNATPVMRVFLIRHHEGKEGAQLRE